MTPLPFWRRYARFFGPDPAADVSDELRFHLEAKTTDLIRQGWNPEAARQEAERQFGDFRPPKNRPADRRENRAQQTPCRSLD